MEIEPISSVDALGDSTISDDPLVAYLERTHAPPVLIALAEAKAKEAETIEQRAGDGDPQALLQVAAEEYHAAPIQARRLQSHPATHTPGEHGIHEDGKGDIVDIYD